MFQWKEEYGIDGGTIDQEHKHLLELADQAVMLVDPAEEAETAMEAIRKVYRCMVQHFRDEEKIMREVEFPECKDHAGEHERIILQMESLFENCHDVRFLAAKMQRFMARWVIDHIMEEDKKFSVYIQSKTGSG